MACPDVLPTILEAAEFLQARGIGYLHMVEADWDDAPQFTEAFRQAIRARFTRSIIVAGNYDKARAEWVLSSGYADLVAFGRPFVANPDFPRRLADGLPMARFDSSTLFGGGEHGYTDYPPLREAELSDQARDAVSLS
jgi:N-ethylmaleimide reductase